MKTKKKTFLMLLLSMVLTVSGTVMAIAATVTPEDFKIVVDTNKDSYDAGDDIYMSINIQNDSDDTTVTSVKLNYNIPDEIAKHIVNYDKLPTTLDSLESGRNRIFATSALGSDTGNSGTGSSGTGNSGAGNSNTENSNTGNSNTGNSVVDNPDTGSEDTVMFFVGIMLVAAGVVVAVRTGYLKKFISVFMALVMIVGVGAVSNIVVQAQSTTIGIEAYKTITYAGEEKVIVVEATIVVDTTEQDTGEDGTDTGEAGTETGDGEAEQTQISGTDLAKLLLANERLDSEELTKDNKIVSSHNMAESLSMVRVTALSTVDASQYADNSNMMDYFNSYISAVKGVTESAAETIDYVKENVSCTDVWIEYGAMGSDVLLKVTDNEEWLFMDNEYSIFVCRRYTDSNGDDVYEIYQPEKTDGTYSYLLCIPDKRYEYSTFVPGQEEYDDFDVHVVVENSRGYWNMFTTNTVAGTDGAEDRMNVQNLVAASEFAYVYYGEIYESGYTSTDFITFIDPTLSCDLISIHENDIEIKLVGFNGIETLEIDEYNFITSLTTIGGDTINVGDEIADGVTLRHGDVAYSETPYGMLVFSVDSDGDELADEINDETVQKVINALAEYGIKCKYDLSKVLTGVNNGFAVADNFGSYYSWNGYYLTDLEAAQSAIAVGDVKRAGLMEGYDKVKDAEKIEITSTGINYEDYDFAKLTLKGAEAVTFADGKVSVDGLQAVVSVADVMMDGEKYEIQFALAELGENDGEYGSAILLGTESSGAESYSGSALSLTKSAEFEIPACTGAGHYTLVAYAATSEGIRVSEMVPVTFTSEAVYENVENGYETYIELNDDGEMLVYYTLMNEYVVTMPEEKESYTYEEVYSFLSEEVMKYGYPSSSAVLEIYDAETGEGTAASEGTVLSGCTCRLQYDIANISGMTGYVYVQLP